MLITPPVPTEVKTSFNPSQETLEIGTCGLLRAPLLKAAEMMPSMAQLVESAVEVVGNDPHEWELDIKIHMLMPGQYPCIPNWHCDNVPRGDQGHVAYNEINVDAEPMYLWVSGEPCTEFLRQAQDIDFIPDGHRQLADFIHRTKPETFSLDAQRWYAFFQNSPHRGQVSDIHTWRIFARLTHKSIVCARPVLSCHRRHSQVYIDADNYGW